MPKPPHTSLPPRTDAPTHRTPDIQLPVFRLPQLSSGLPALSLDTRTTRVGTPPAQDRGPGTSTVPAVTDSPLITHIANASATAPSLADYLLKPPMLRGMQPANTQGFRYIVGRTFADVKGIGTVHIEFDPSANAYRATDLYKRLPPGPVLFKNEGEPTWRTSLMAEQANPLKRPLPLDFFSGASSLSKVHGAQRPSVPDASTARSELLSGPFKSLFPDKTPEEHAQLLRNYNLSPTQHAQLLADLRKHAKIPEWATLHKQQTEDPNNPLRFDQLRQEIQPLIRAIRSEDYSVNHPQDFEDSISQEFLNGFLETLGYKRNLNGQLYRTDIPGLFRADDRTLVELTNDNEMLPRMKHRAGSTTGTPISASVSLQEVQTYNKGSPPSAYLKYNYQTDSRPPRNPNRTYTDSESSDGDTSDSSQSSQSSGSDDNSEMIRRNQRFGFIYVIDTRGMEVVLKGDNLFFNTKGANEDAWLPDDDLEAHLSVPKGEGIPSDRIWLMHSSLTRAANIEDLAAQAGSFRRDIEARTHAGRNNKDEYDTLIDQVAAAGKPILQIKENAFADDIVWPQRLA